MAVTSLDKTRGQTIPLAVCCSMLLPRNGVRGKKKKPSKFVFMKDQQEQRPDYHKLPLQQS
jgi:hypothetical protein